MKHTANKYFSEQYKHQKKEGLSSIAVMTLILLIGLGCGYYIGKNYDIILFSSPQEVQQSALTSEASSDEIKGQPLNFTVVDSGDYSIGTHKAFVINSNSDWQNVWHIAHGHETQRSEPKSIDFETYTLLAVFQGTQPTGGYSIHIVKIIETDKNIEVYVEADTPDKNCMVTQAVTDPYEIVGLKKLAKPIHFTEAQKTSICSNRAL